MASEEGGSGSGGARSNRSGGGRRNGKGPKRPPQRGLGVEQLERLRMEESLKKAAEASGIPNFLHHHSQFPPQFYPQQMYGSSGSVPMRFGAGVGAPAPSSSAWLSPSYIEQQCRLGFGSGGPIVRNNTFESSKDLTSIPNHTQYLDNLCLKKTRLYDENGHGSSSSSNVRKDHRTFHDFLGSIPQPQPAVAAASAVVSSYATPKHDNEGVEVVAVHRRGDSSGGNGKVVMEYEFFPGKYGRLATTINKELEYTKIGSVEEVGGGGSGGSEGSSSITFSAYGDATTASNSLDLSLKL